MHLNIKRQQIIIDSMYIFIKSAWYKNRAHGTINLLLIICKTPFTMIWFIRVQHTYFLALIQGNAKSLVLREQTYCEWIEEYFSRAMESTVLLFHNGFSIFTLKVCSTVLCNHVQEENILSQCNCWKWTISLLFGALPLLPSHMLISKITAKLTGILPADNVWDPNIRIYFLR